MNKKHQFPTLPHPHKRREALPWQQPKAPEEDPEALQRVRAILNSPSYRRADNDIDFLARDGVRGVRVQIDYLKPELLLQEHEIRHTIVVFGSTRICEPAAARRRVEALRASLAADPNNIELGRRLAIAERIHAKSHYYEVAREFGRLVGSANRGSRKHHSVIITGGGRGMMEAANRGAFDVGAKSVGLNISLPHEQYPNPYVTPELCFSFHYFAMRKLHFLLRAKALVAFPGGYGTFDELFEVLTLVQTRTHRQRKCPPGRDRHRRREPRRLRRPHDGALRRRQYSNPFRPWRQSGQEPGRTDRRCARRNADQRRLTRTGTTSVRTLA